jgi:hypothetical protein
MASSRFDLVPLSRHDERMRHWTRPRRVAPAAVSIALLVAGCADDSNSRGSVVAGSETQTSVESTSGSPATTDTTATETTELRSDDETIALGLCSALRGQANVMTEIANTAAADIHEKSPAERYAALFDGYDRGAAASNAFRDSLDDLSLPTIPELEDLIGQIAAGADAAAAEFVDEQARFADAVDGEVADDDARGRVGELFNSIEKANSLVEPVIVRYERVELKRAFLEEPECRYVIQQFVLDES